MKTPATASDFAAANQGQVKNLARAAMEHLDAHLPGGAGETVRALVARWAVPGPATSDFSAVNAGQLKRLARPFYDRLIDVGYTDRYPWSPRPGVTPPPRNDFAAVNLGQVKRLFDFNLEGYALPGLVIVNGNNQVDKPEEVLETPLVVQVRDSLGVPVAGAAVTFMALCC